MSTVLLVRHGQASFGAENYDVLSTVGVRQAEIAAASLAPRGYEPSRIISGTLQRQRETAAAFAGPAAVEIDERWDEFHPDDVLTHHSATAVRLEGPRGATATPLTSEDFQAALKPALGDWIEMAEGSPTAQTWTQFSNVGAAALADLGASLESGETAVVVTSAGVIAALVGVLLGAPAPIFKTLNPSLVNAAVTSVAIGPTATSIVTVNDHSHLEKVDRSLVTHR